MFNYESLQSSITFYHIDLCWIHSYTITFHLVPRRCASRSRILLSEVLREHDLVDECVSRSIGEVG